MGKKDKDILVQAVEALTVARGWGSHIFRHSAYRWRQGCQPYAPVAFYPQEDWWYSLAVLFCITCRIFKRVHLPRQIWVWLSLIYPVGIQRLLPFLCIFLHFSDLITAFQTFFFCCKIVYFYFQWCFNCEFYFCDAVYFVLNVLTLFPHLYTEPAGVTTENCHSQTVLTSACPTFQSRPHSVCTLWTWNVLEMQLQSLRYLTW
jgi:hypothetical protein